MPVHHILLVDDEQHIVDVVEYLLVEDHFDVTVSMDGDSALSRVRQRPERFSDDFRAMIMHHKMLYMPALPYDIAGMKKSRIQYTIRDVPSRLDAKLRETATAYGQSLNEASLAALKRGLGVGDSPPPAHHDLDDLAGTWVRDEAGEQALDEMRQIDEGMWQ